MVRTCPFCKSHLSLSDKFFCSECGEALPQDLVVHNNPKSKTLEFVSSIVPKKTIAGVNRTSTYKKNKIKVLLLIVVTLLIPVLALFLFEKTAVMINKMVMPSNAQSIVTSSKETVGEQNNNFVIHPKCSFSEGILLNTDLVKLIPFNADFYLESQDSVGLFKELIDSEIITEPKFVSFYDEYKNSLSNSLGFFVMKKPSEYVYGIVSKAQNLNISQEEMAKYSASKVGEFVVLTTDSTVMSDVKDASVGTAKNFSLNPTYASAKLLLPKKGKLVILPASKVGKGYLFQLLDNNPSSNILLIVNEFLDSKLDYAVVL